VIPVTASDLGIELSDTSSHGLYKWLLASFLIGKRIRSTVAVETYHSLVDRHGLDTPAKLARCSHQQLVVWLGLAGYARYDQSTARRLHALGAGLSSDLDAQLSVLRQGLIDLPTFERWLLSFEGIGIKTLEIFMREAAALLDNERL